MTIPAVNLCFASLMAFIGFVVCEDFCQAFRDYGDKVDYIYHRDLNSNPDSEAHHIIIDGTYWTFRFIYGKDARVQFNSSVSGSAPKFTKYFFGAACLRTSDQSCETLLFGNSDVITAVEVITIPGDNFTEVEDLSKFENERSAFVKPELTIQSDLKFVFRGQSNVRRADPIIDFVVRIGPNVNNSFLRFQFNTDSENFNIVNLTQELIDGISNQSKNDNQSFPLCHH